VIEGQALGFAHGDPGDVEIVAYTGDRGADKGELGAVGRKRRLVVKPSSRR